MKEILLGALGTLGVLGAKEIAIYGNRPFSLSASATRLIAIVYAAVR